MSRARQILLALLLAVSIAPGVAQATPLATFATTDLAQGLFNFPLENGVDYGPGPGPGPSIAGTLGIRNHERRLFVLGGEYLYERSVIAYFEFKYRFIADDGMTVVDDNLYYAHLFASPSDYIDVGWVPDGGLYYDQAFDARTISTAFNSTYRGLADNDWMIYGFRASVRHIYQPLGEPATELLVGVAALAGLRRKRQPGP